MVYKWCLVQECTNTSTKTPEKLFVSVPKKANIRNKWLQLASRHPKEIVVNSSVFFCEDHFDMEKDIKNFNQYKMGFSQRLLIKDGVLPSKFGCNQDHSKRCDPNTSQDSSIERFPSDSHLHAAWLGALGRQDTPLLDPAVVCSQHFLSEDMYETESGSWQLRTGAIPSTVQVCLICFDTKSKLYPMTKYKLDEAYEHLVGYPLHDSGNLRQTLCVQCAQRLVNFSKFRDKSLRARSLMMELVQKHELITMQHLDSMNEVINELKHNMVKTVQKPDHCDLHIDSSNEDTQMAVDTDASVEAVVVKREDIPMSVDENNLQVVVGNEDAPNDFNINLVVTKEEYLSDEERKPNLTDPLLVTPSTSKEHTAPTTLIKHERFDCSICSEEFADEDAYNYHMTTHMEENQDSGNPAEGASAEFESSSVTPSNVEPPTRPTFYLVVDGAAQTNPIIEAVIRKACNRVRQACVDKPKSNSKVNRLKSNSKVNRPKSNSKINKPKTNSKVNRPTSNSKIKPKSNSKVNRPTSNSKIKPKSNSKGNRPTSNSKINKPKSNSKVNRPTSNSKINKPKSNSKVNRPTSNSKINKPKSNSKVNRPTSNSNVYKSRSSSNVNKPKSNSKINNNKHKSSSEVNKPKSNSKVNRPIRKSKMTLKSKNEYVSLRTNPTLKSVTTKTCQIKKNKTNIKKTSKSKSKKSDKRFICEICNAMYKCKVHLLVHLRRHTGEKPFSCYLCELRFARKLDLVKHQKHHTRITSCDHDNHRTHENSFGRQNTSKSESEHNDEINLQTIPTLESVTTKTCKLNDPKINIEKASQSLSEYNGEINLETGTTKTCKLNEPKNNIKYTPQSISAVSFQTNFSLEPVTTITCKIKKPKTNIKKTSKFKSKRGDKHFICKICELSFTRKLELVKHQKHHTRITLSDHDYDRAQENSFGRQHSHLYMTTYTGEYPYDCEFCNYKHKMRRDLVTHIRTHTGEKPFSCDLCKFKLARMYKLVRYVSTHTGEGCDTLFTCEICNATDNVNKVYKQEINLINHLRSHTGDKPFPCDQCELKFERKCDLVKHQRHTHIALRDHDYLH